MQKILYITDTHRWLKKSIDHGDNGLYFGLRVHTLSKEQYPVSYS